MLYNYLNYYCFQYYFFLQFCEEVALFCINYMHIHVQFTLLCSNYSIVFQHNFIALIKSFLRLFFFGILIVNKCASPYVFVVIICLFFFFQTDDFKYQVEYNVSEKKSVHYISSVQTINVVYSVLRFLSRSNKQFRNLLTFEV